MAQSLEKLLNQKLAGIFAKHGLDTKFAVVKVSDRPDLSDFQCNGALALAKPLRRNPREIATLIAGELEQDADIAKISVDGPGFTISASKKPSLPPNWTPWPATGVSAATKPKRRKKS